MATHTARGATAPRPAPRQAAARGETRPRRTAERAPAAKKTAPANDPGRRPAVASAGPHRPVAHALLAAERAVRSNSTQLRLPVVGDLHMPAPEEVAFIGGVAVLAVAGLIEWPLAVLLGVGHVLATSRRNKVVRSFGEALEEA